MNNNQNVIKEEENTNTNKQNIVNKEVEISQNQDNEISNKGQLIFFRPGPGQSCLIFIIKI